MPTGSSERQSPQAHPARVNPVGDASRAQQSMWFLCQVADSSVYNLPSAVRLRGTLNEDALSAAFAEIVARHDILRTVFSVDGGRLRQQALPRLTLELAPTDVAGKDLSSITALMNADTQTAFAFEREPPWRVKLYRLAPDDHVLLLVHHHLIWDGWSIGIFVRELKLLYDAFNAGRRSPLPVLARQYADFVDWEKRSLTPEVLSERMTWWRAALQGCEDLRLPTDYPRPAIQSHNGAQHPVLLPMRLVPGLERLAQRAGVTLFMTLMAGFGVLLSRYADQQRFALGTPNANRGRSEFEGVIGYFANLLVIAVDTSGDPTFSQVLQRIKRVTLGAFQHQDIPFDSIVEQLNVPRDPSRNPVFQVMFGFHSENLSHLELSGLRVEPVAVGTEQTHFDMGLHLWRRAAGIGGYISYNQDLFSSSTVERFALHLCALLEALVAAPEAPLSSLSVGTAAPSSSRPRGQREPELAREPLGETLTAALRAAGERRVLSASDGAGGQTELSGRELLAAAERVASTLRGVESDGNHALAIRAEAGVARAAAILGALFAGRRFWVVDAGTDSARFAALCRRVGVKRVLHTGLCAVPRGVKACALVDLIGADADPSTERAAPPSHESRPVTGRSRSEVAVVTGDEVRWCTELALGARVSALQQRLALRVGESFVRVGPDAAALFPVELLWPLTAGARVVIPDSRPRDNLELADSIADGWLHVTPSGLRDLLERASVASLHRLRGLRGILCSGGLLSTRYAEELRQRIGCPLIYAYAPPEADAELPFTRFQSQRGARWLGFVETPSAARAVVLEPSGQPAPSGLPGLLQVDGVNTLDRARSLASGELQLLGSVGRSVFALGNRVDLDALAGHLRRLPGIVDLHLQIRPDADGPEVIAWVVRAGSASLEQVERLLEPQLTWARVSVVCLTRLPVTTTGVVDESALQQFSVSDRAVCALGEKRLLELPEIREAAVTLESSRTPLALAHVAELLPGIHSRGSLEVHSSHGRSDNGRAAPARTRDGPLAQVTGPPLQIPEQAPRTLVDALLRAAARPSVGVTTIDEIGQARKVSYASLLLRSLRILAGLQRAGLKPQDRVVLQLSSLEEHLATFWACILGGIAPLTVARSRQFEQKDPSLGKLHNSWKLLDHPAVVVSEVQRANLCSALGLYASPTDPPLRLISVDELERSEGHGELHRARAEDTCFLQLTSGSTGLPKCVQETHSAVLHHVWAASSFNGYTDRDVSLNWLPMDHVVPTLTFHLRDVTLGIEQVHVEPSVILAEPLRWLDYLEQYRATLSWAPNFGFKLVTDALERARHRNWSLAHVRYLTNAGEQVTLPVSLEFIRATRAFGLKDTALQPAYGMAEVATIISYAQDFGHESCLHRVRKRSLAGRLEFADDEEPETIPFVDVGPPVPGVELRITDENNVVLPERRIGSLQMRGPFTMLGYLNNPEANAAVFVGDGWFESGDLGFIHEGRLTITGRKKEMIVVRGANFYCYEIEDAVNSLTGVRPTFTGVCAVDDPLTGSESLAVFFVPEQERHSGARRDSLSLGAPMAALVLSVRECIVREFGVTPAYVVPLTQDEFPKTTSGKIQRAELRRALQVGVFETRLRRLDILAANHNTIPDWFFETTWVPEPLPARAPTPIADIVLVFGSGGELSASLSARLPNVVRVDCTQGRDGECFEELSQLHYRVDPSSADGHRRLWVTLAERVGPIDTVLVLGTSDGAPRGAGCASLLALSQAAGPASAERGVDVALWCVQVGDPEELELSVDQAEVRALCKVIGQEWPALRCRTLELPRSDPDGVAVLIESEVRARAAESEVAYREGQRQVRRLRKARWTAQPDGLPFSSTDLIVVSGGLGGAGAAVCRWLLAEHRACVLVLGRTPIACGDGGASEAGRTRELERLEAHPGRVCYSAVDITDEAAVRCAVAEAERTFGKKAVGAFHLAGVFPTVMLAEETPQGIAAATAPKLEGARVLDRVLGAESFLIGFGSVYAEFGAAACGAYAVGNAALGAFVAERRQRARGRSLVIRWSHWLDTGMSEGYLFTNQSQARGFCMIDAELALRSLVLVAATDVGEVSVGLDPTGQDVARLLDAPARPVDVPTAWVVPERSETTPDLNRLQLLDIRQRPVRLQLQLLEALPQNPDGSVDRRRLVATGPGCTGAELVPPNSQTERVIAAIWCDVLGLERVSVEDTFFTLGGQSVMVLQVISRIHQKTGRRIAVIDFFRCPTIRLLANFISSSVPERASFEQAAKRGAKQRGQASRPAWRGRTSDRRRRDDIRS
jgi:acyl-CoA synthetase (AMP-forming)/AMP-acid ligase II/acyl carrier protein